MAVTGLRRGKKPKQKRKKMLSVFSKGGATVKKQSENEGSHQFLDIMNNREILNITYQRTVNNQCLGTKERSVLWSWTESPHVSSHVL